MKRKTRNKQRGTPKIIYIHTEEKTQAPLSFFHTISVKLNIWNARLEIGNARLQKIKKTPSHAVSLSKVCVCVCACIWDSKYATRDSQYVLSQYSLHVTRVLQCAAVCCSVLQCVAVCCSVLQTTTHCTRLNSQCPMTTQQVCVAMCRSVLQCVAVFCSVLQCVAVCCSVLQCVADHHSLQTPE